MLNGLHLWPVPSGFTDQAEPATSWEGNYWPAGDETSSWSLLAFFCTPIFPKTWVVKKNRKCQNLILTKQGCWWNRLRAGNPEGTCTPFGPNLHDLGSCELRWVGSTGSPRGLMGWMVTNHSGQKTKTHRLILIVMYTNYTMFSKLRSYIVQREPMVSRVFGV